MKTKNQHQPVLLADVLRLLDPQPGESYLDATAGYGGHAKAVMSRVGDSGRKVLVDRDTQATRWLEERFGDRAQIIHSNYFEAVRQLTHDGSLFDLILLDLGVSSPQFDNPERGFSFQNDGPLDMRMDQSQGLTAAEVVNQYSVRQLSKLLLDYGQERWAKKIAREIVTARPIKSTGELARVIRKVVPTSGQIDPATRSFQAIRIEVNSELSELKQALPEILKLLTPGGRLAVISFHSLEDGVVKSFFDRESRDCVCPPESPICTCDHRASLVKLTRGAISGHINDAINPRARSAKLRAVKKINQNQKEVQT